MVVELSQNEFIDHNDYVGFLSPDPEPYNFLSIEDKTTESSPSSSPKASFIIKLSDKKRNYERQVYTFMTLIGDIGGFYGAILTIPSLILSNYSKTMFESSLQENMPVRMSKKRKNTDSSNRGIRRLMLDEASDKSNDGAAPDAIREL